jgi:hypothetical protein
VLTTTAGSLDGQAAKVRAAVVFVVFFPAWFTLRASAMLGDGQLAVGHLMQLGRWLLWLESMLDKATPSWVRAVFHAGPSKQMNWFYTSGAGGQVAAGSRPGNDAMNGNAVMYDFGKILTLGGATAYDTGSPATAAAAVITLPVRGTAPPSVTPTGSMAFARAYCNSVVLPDGKVVVIGGMPAPVPFSDANAVLTPGVVPFGNQFPTHPALHVAWSARWQPCPYRR